MAAKKAPQGRKPLQDEARRSMPVTAYIMRFQIKDLGGLEAAKELASAYLRKKARAIEISRLKTQK